METAADSTGTTRQLPGYQIREKIHFQRGKNLYRGTRLADGVQVLIKSAGAEYPTKADLQRLRSEFAITHALGVAGVLQGIALEKWGNGLALVLEDAGGIPLALYSHGKPFGTEEFLSPAIRLADILIELHRRDIVHRDINPDGIYLLDAPEDVRLTNFGLAWRAGKPPSGDAKAPLVPSAYTSPEETGRTNRTVDHRSDLYSLGAVFYEMLTGHRPFTFSDPAELVHSIMARMPDAPGIKRDSIPPALSDIVMKLLSKTPEARYKTAASLKADLEECQARWKRTRSIGNFPLGLAELSTRIQPGGRLYGRGSESDGVLAALARACEGRVEILAITGPSGVGKSALASTLLVPTLKRKGHFAAGKSDQYSRQEPYFSLIQALRQVMGQLLSEGGAKAEATRRRTLDAVGGNGRIIVDALPEAEWLMGKQPQTAAIGPVEAQNRFKLVFGNFIRALAAPGQPLVLLLEDIQWADSPTLNMIRALASEPHSCNFLLAVTGREMEGEAMREWSGHLNAIRESGSRVTEIRLQPLDEPELCRMISDTLGCSEEMVTPLSRLVGSKTGGNPYFAFEFLKAMDAAGHLRFGETAGSADIPAGGWRWDLDAIGGMRITDNVVDLLVERIYDQGEEVQEILKVAACLGGKFDGGTLAEIRPASGEESKQALMEAVRSGFIRETEGGYEFEHDRVHQAAYVLLSEDERARIHLRIGKLERGRLAPNRPARALFATVDHLNAGSVLLTAEQERLELAALNLEAGRRAKGSAAFALASQYFDTGSLLLPADAWRSQYDLLFPLTSERAQCEYLLAHFTEAEALFEELLSKAGSPLDKVSVMATRMQLLEQELKMEEIVRTGLAALGLLGVRLSPEPSPLAMMGKLAEVKLRLAGKRVESLSDLPDRTTPESRAAMNILMNLWGPSHWINQILNGMVVLKMVELSLRHGNTEASPIAYICYGVFMSLALRSHKEGMKLAKMSISLAEKYGNPLVLSRTLFVYATFFGPRARNNARNLEDYRRGYKLSRESGDMIYAGYALSGIVSTLPLSCSGLDELKSELDAYSDFYRQWGDDGMRAVINLLGRWDGMLREPGHSPDEPPTFDPAVLDPGNSRFESVRGVHYLFQLQLDVLLGHPSQALETAAKLVKNPILQGHAVQASCYHLYLALALSVLCTEGGTERRRHLKRLRGCRSKLAALSALAPESASHAHLLICAEVAALEGRKQAAADLYERAIQAASDGGYMLDEAVANEAAFRFYHRQGLRKIANAYFADCYHAYRSWGAFAKTGILEASYPPYANFAAGRFKRREGQGTGGVQGLDDLDLRAVMKASQAISGEIVLDRLMEKLLKIIIENAGAQRGLLIMEKKGTLMVEAASGDDDGDIAVQLSQPLEECKDVSVGIVNFVAGTEQDLVLVDASNDSRFSRDGYVKANEVRSVLCSPLMQQGKLIAIIYLENNLTPGAFTPERLETLRLLSGQATISLMNADFHALQIQALQAKINPHFLFNALSSIADLTATDPQNAEGAIMKLSRLYRYILTSSESRTVFLSQELEIVRAYLELEKLRLGKRLEYSMEVSGGLENVQLPGLVIQPLVENCIRHGLSPRVAGGRVDVHATVAGNECRISVTDDGIGWNKSRPGAGHGLKNVQQRLSLIFGEDYALSINPGNGVRIEVTIPIKY